LLIGNRNSVGNYRPISLLNVFEKIREKLMYKRLYNYLSSNNALYDYQFGFRKYHSTSLALIDVLDDIYHQLDNGNIVIGIYLDVNRRHLILLIIVFYCPNSTITVFVEMLTTGLKVICMIDDNLFRSK